MYLFIHYFIFLLQKYLVAVTRDCISRNLISILADLCHTVVCIISILPQIFSTAYLFKRMFWDILSAQMIMGITFIFMFHSFYSLHAKFWYFFLIFLQLHLGICQDSHIHFLGQNFFSLFIKINACLLDFIG